MEEIIEYIYLEIKNSGYEKKLIGGIVLTGGGAQMKHIAQLTEFKTGMETPGWRIAKHALARRIFLVVLGFMPSNIAF